MTAFSENNKQKCWWISKMPLYLQCVFHGIRFKVKKMGCRETTFFIFIPFGFISEKYLSPGYPVG